MKGRKHRESGGVNEAKEDEDTKPEARTDAKKIDSEAEERKRGGRAKRKRGGKTEVGKVEGHEAAHHAGRKPRAKEDRDHRATGGRTARAHGGSASDSNPFTSARKGTDPKDHKVMKGDCGFGED